MCKRRLKLQRTKKVNSQVQKTEQRTGPGGEQHLDQHLDQVKSDRWGQVKWVMKENGKNLQWVQLTGLSKS